ncbi:sortase [Niallia sp. 01092]|uniref:sortase n=1 Tax=unclassified Niallia TaxID=2837522 RepID=UPI003FD0E2C9
MLVFYHGGLLLKSEIPLRIPDKQFNKMEKQELNTRKFYKEGAWIGAIYLPSVDQSIDIYEGTNDKVLNKGIGHFTRSSFPGEQNNSVLSGHRDTFFRVLKDVKRNDFISIQTVYGAFYYKVRKIDIVSADSRDILTPKSRPVLTLTTCYPFYFIGDAPQRYIITADLIKSVDATL